MKQTVTSFIDFFYPPFKRWMPLLTFRYAVCGGGNTLFALAIFSIGYHYVFDKNDFHFWMLTFKPHIASLFLSGIFSFAVGFFLNKYVVFVESNLKGRVQLFRYLLSFAFNLCLNFVMLKLMVEVFNWDAVFSQIITTIIVIAVSYVTQKYFTFKTT